MNRSLTGQSPLEVLLGENGDKYATTFAIHKFTGKPHSNVLRTADSFLPMLGIDPATVQDYITGSSNGIPIRVYAIPLHHAVTLTCKVDPQSGSRLTEQLLRMEPPSATGLVVAENQPRVMDSILEYLQRLDDRFSAIESKSINVGHAALPAPSVREALSAGIREEVPLSARDIGQILSVSAQYINKMFVELGFQTMVGSVYRPTRKVDGLYVVTKSSSNSGNLRIDRFRWKKEILDRIPVEYR